MKKSKDTKNTVVSQPENPRRTRAPLSYAQSEALAPYKTSRRAKDGEISDEQRAWKIRRQRIENRDENRRLQAEISPLHAFQVEEQNP